MDEKALAVSENILTQLKTYEDYLAYYIQIDEVSAAFSWLKADLLLQMAQDLGEKSVETLSNDVKQPRSTVINYVRVAKAFPKDKRIPHVSFSAHFQASYADSYDDKSHEFDGEERFKWLEKAADEGLSTRQLAEAIRKDKAIKKLGSIMCNYCGRNTEEVRQYNIYSPGLRHQDTFDLHEDCYNLIVRFISKYGKD